MLQLAAGYDAGSDALNPAGGRWAGATVFQASVTRTTPTPSPRSARSVGPGAVSMCTSSWKIPT